MSTGMGYEGAVLRYFFGETGGALADEVDALTVAINEDSVGHLERLIDFARDCDLEGEEEICDFAEELATQINLRDLELGGLQRSLRERIKSFGATHMTAEHGAA